MAPYYDDFPTPEHIAEVQADPDAMKSLADESKARATRMEKMLTEYQELGQGNDAQTALGDLIANLLHFAEQHEVSFEEALAAGRWHFAWEHVEP